MLKPQWLISSPQEVPPWFLAAVQVYTPDSDGHYAAQLLWQRGIQELDQLRAFVDVDAYQPTSPFAFGQEMKWAVKRLEKAFKVGEKVTIWGDFDADGITSTSVLWEGLGQFLVQHLTLTYYIPDRQRESHGLNCSGIEKLAASGTQLIVTCDTGSTNLSEIDYAHQLGIDIIITDHHTLPEDRPTVVAMINPRYFAEHHPLFNLSGVAVAYKLIEALYQTFPEIPQQPIESLLDLVAIGLIADLVQLSGDCRYLAQKGIQQLQKQGQNPTRPGIFYLLKFCQKVGDRPTDISFGIGPRINAISRIHGDASFGVELLTSREGKYCYQLASETELANTRRKALQKDLVTDVKRKLSHLDLSTTRVIVLEDSQWQGGILGLVAGQIAQEYGRPTILLTTAQEIENQQLTRQIENENSSLLLARGSARSVNNIDLYQLVKSQEHLLHRFGGHPLAAGLSLPMENIALFREAINQQLRQQLANSDCLQSTLQADLVVTVADLSQSLFRELKLLEPCGMGNPVPKLLIKNCWFEKIWHNNAEDLKGKKVQYIKTKFEIWDDSNNAGFPGIWWDHYKDELSQNEHYDAVIELDFNTYKKRYEIRLIDIKVNTSNERFIGNIDQQQFLLDWRNNQQRQSQEDSLRILQNCPVSWGEISKEYHNALSQESKLALAYPSPKLISSRQIWQQLVGIAKYLSRTNQEVTKEQLQKKLSLSDRSFNLGLKALADIGFQCSNKNNKLKIYLTSEISPTAEQSKTLFLETAREEQFQRHYFYQVPLETFQRVLSSES